MGFGARMRKPVAPEDKLSEQFVVRVTPAEAAALDKIKDEGFYPSRNDLVRSLLRAIIQDDAKAHGRQE